jgi:3-oxoacyl-[acyl-carrier-protein] synthase I
MPGDVVVIGVGMMTAVGLSAPESAASVRSRVARFTETSIRDHRFEPFTLAEVVEDGLPDLAPGVDNGAAPRPTGRELRMLRLATMPLRECLAALPAGAPAPGLLLALPSTKTTRPLDGKSFLTRLARQADGAFDLERSDASERGRAGGITVVGRAAAAIGAGQGTFMLAGGVDTYRDLYVLGTLDMEQRVKSSAHLDGFIPGEGAAFLLLASREAAAAAGARPLATVSPAVTALEPGHLYSDEPYRGDGLAAALAQLAQSGAAGGPVQDVYSSMNGESHWAKEWGVAFLRNRPAFAEEHGMHHPADSFGDTGAACGPLMAGLAALAIRDGYGRSPCLVYGSSDDGPRAALAVTAA